MAKTVKAWTFTHEGYPKALHQSSIEAPAGSPGPTELHVRIHAAALNPVDIQLQNLPVWAYLPTSLVPNEKGVGKDFAGIVEAAGSESGFKPGDEVFGITMAITLGTVQQLAVIDTKASAVTLKSSDWSWQEAASLPLVWLTARTTIAAVEPYITSRKKIAVLGGSSSTGMYAVHIAKSRGWSVISSCSGRNADFVTSMGADEIIDYTSSSVPERVKAFAPDAIIDCVGGTGCIGLAKRYVTIVGDKTSRATMGGAAIYLWHPRMLLRMLLGRTGLGNPYDCVNLELNAKYLEETLRLPREKITIDSIFEFDQVPDAFERLNTARTRGKVVVRIQ